MSWLPTALVALLALLLLRELVTLLRARAPAQTQVIAVGEQAPPCGEGIPRVIWSYWQESPPPPFIQACHDNWRRHAPDHELRLLDPASAAAWLPALRADFHTLPAARQADALRLQLLARHGGIWMDASMLLSRDLAWLHETRRRRAAEFVGFYVDAEGPQPALAGWLMASVAGGRFIGALAEGDEIAPTPLPIAAAALLAREPQTARLALLRAEDGPLAWQTALGGSARRLYARLALLPCPRMLPAVLELRAAEHALVERNWRRGLVSPFSALRHLLDRQP